jgi:hypothetical protein
MANINSVDIMALKKGEVNLGVSHSLLLSASFNLDLLALDIPQERRGTRSRELDTHMLDWAE